jgi:hypothetical protein
MKQFAQADSAEAREQAAAEERAAILQIIERYMRHLSHGHGATGAQVLQTIVEEIERRGATSTNPAK